MALTDSDIFYQGDDFNRVITVQDENGVIDLDTLSEITIYIFQKNHPKSSLKKTLSGGTVEKTDAANGELLIRLQSDETKNLKPAIYQVQIETEAADTDYEDDIRTAIGIQDAFQIKRAV